MRHSQRLQKILATLTLISATFQATVVNRATQARIKAKKSLGYIPTAGYGHGSYGARADGHGPDSHTMEQRTQIGSRRFIRQQRRMVNTLSWHPFSKMIRS